MLVSIASVGINYAAAVTAIRVVHLGHAGLAMSTSVVALFGFVVLFSILRNRIGGVYGRELATGVAKVGAAAAVMGGAVALSTHVMARWLGVSQLARLADLAVSIPIGLAVFYGMCRATGVSDLDMAIRAVGRPIRRRMAWGK
jgi:putative peptidoglycan lipid II flippase